MPETRAPAVTSRRNWPRRTAAGLFRHPLWLVAGVVCLALLVAYSRVGWWTLWATPDQRGRWLMERQRYAAAAESFAQPMWRGVALMKAGNFKDAAQEFGGLDTAEAAYDHGNALVMLGRYDDAITRYDRALELRPGWADAEANREIARLRAERVKTKGGDETGGEVDADQVVFEKGHKNGSPEEEAAGESSMSDEAIRALWLKRVATRPADFLRAKFAYQLRSAAPDDAAAGKPP